MRLRGLALANLRRSRFRTALTVLAAAVAVLTFVMLRTTVGSWMAGVNAAAQDRIVTRHKVTFVMTLPRRYAADVRALPGVKVATWCNWFGGKDPRHEREFFAQFAADTDTFFQVYDEMVVPPAQLAAWKQDRTGVIVGDVLAKKLGWKLGDRVTLVGSIYAGDWQFRVLGIYTATRKSVDRSTFVMHWSYLNERSPAPMKDQIGWVVSRVADPRQAATVTATIDRAFDDRDIQTLSQSERAFNLSFIGMLSAVLQAIDVVSVAILSIMMLILGNTIAMSVRERVHEHGVLRALGFAPGQLVALILGEAALCGLLGGVVGLGLAYPIVEQGMGRWLEENMGAMFPFFRIEQSTALLALALPLVLGMLAALPSAVSTLRMRVVDTLRHVA